MGVHLDDGPDKPYYTIEFEREGEKIEKQTMSERVKRIVVKEVEKEERVFVGENEVEVEGAKEKEEEKEKEES